MKRVNIWMDEEVHKQLKIIAALKGITIQEFVEQAIQAKVKKDLVMIKDLVK